VHGSQVWYPSPEVGVAPVRGGGHRRRAGARRGGSDGRQEGEGVQRWPNENVVRCLHLPTKAIVLSILFLKGCSSLEFVVSELPQKYFDFQWQFGFPDVFVITHTYPYVWGICTMILL
jgi:hypothetical protein